MIFINTLIFIEFGAMISFLISDSSYFPYFLLSLVFVGIMGWVNYQLFHFRELKFFVLKKYAKRWVQKYSDIQIKRIFLFRYSSKYQEYYPFLKDGEMMPIKYALVFEILNCDKEFELLEARNQESINETLERVKSGKQKTALEEFIDATEFNRRYPRNYRAFIDSSFVHVYANNPGKNFLNDWVFIPVKRGGNLGLNILTNEPHWTLY